MNAGGRNMDRYVKPRLEHVQGDTWCIVTGSCRIPLYMPHKDNAVMIDSGLKDPDRYSILGILEQEKIHVSALLTSHYHRDHIGNHSVIKDRFGAQVYMSPFTASVCSNGHQNTMGETGMLTVLRGGHIKCNCDTMFDPEALSIQAAGYDFKLIPLPGHAQEHTGFVTPDDVAYLGDTILSRDILHAVRIPYCTFCKEDLETKATVRSLKHQSYILAHNCVCSNISDLAQENIDNMHDKINMVERFTHSYITLENLAAKVMTYTGADTDSLIKVLGNKRNVQVLVEYLLETGRLDIRARDGRIEYIKTT